MSTSPLVTPGRDIRSPAPGALELIINACRRRQPKADVHGHRARSIQDTWSLVEPLLPEVNVTRLADITGLDVVGIPVYQAIVPASDDRISTYSGKGLHPLAAKVSAAMEAYERFYGNHPPDVDGVFSLNHAVQSGWPVLDPRDGAVEVRATYTDDDPIAWAWGYDIGREMAVLVPAEQFSSSYVNPGSPVFDLVTTNGLASGNNLTEAILHGLYEVVERDAWTIADVLGQRLPDLADPEGSDGGKAGANVHVVSAIDVTSLPPRLQEHVERFHAQGIVLEMYMLRVDTRVPTCLAVTVEDESPMSRAHMGLGTDADPETAVGRAITEVAQTRCIDAAGGREDLNRRGQQTPSWARRLSRSADAKPAPHPPRAASFAEFDGYASDDITRDLQETLNRLRDVGLDRVVVVDLTPPGSDFAVCKVLVQGAEVWASDKGKVGQRLTDAWNAAVQRRQHSSGFAQ